MTIQIEPDTEMEAAATFIGLAHVDKNLWLARREVSSVRPVVMPDGDTEVTVRMRNGDEFHLRRTLRDVLSCLAGNETWRSQTDD